MEPLIYVFFEPVPWNIKVEGHPTHKFKCSACGCKATVCHYLDTKDAASTGNLCRHAKSCWGANVVSGVDDAKNADEVHTSIRPGLLRDGSITSVQKKRSGKDNILSPPAYSSGDQVSSES